MGDRETLIALAERVEKATGPNRALDAEIAAALRITPGTPGTEWLKKWDGPFIANPASHAEPGRVAVQNGCWWRAFDCTASLDLALTLIGGDEFWRVGHNHDDPSHFTAQVSYSQPPSVVGFVIADGDTPALALTAAALRARAETQEPRHD